MKKEVEKYKELLNQKEIEIKKLEEIEQQRTLTNELSVIEDQIGYVNLIVWKISI